MRVDVDVRTTPATEAAVANAAQRWIAGRLAPAVAAEARIEAPVGKPDRLGRPRVGKPMKDTIAVRPTHTGAEVIVNSDHFLPVHEGAKPHPIRPKRRGYPLRFYWDKVGGEFRTMKVNHPGNRGNPFLVRALRVVIGRLR